MHRVVSSVSLLPTKAGSYRIVLTLILISYSICHTLYHFLSTNANGGGCTRTLDLGIMRQVFYYCAIVCHSLEIRFLKIIVYYFLKFKCKLFNATLVSAFQKPLLLKCRIFLKNANSVGFTQSTQPKVGEHPLSTVIILFT